MKKQLIARQVMSAALLFSGLALLVGCIGGGEEKKDADVAPRAAEDGVVLLTIEGKPAITKVQFDDFFDAWLQSRQDGAFAAFDPRAQRRAFADLEMMKVLEFKMKKEGKDKDPEYQKKYERAHNLALFAVNSEILVEELMKTIDVSDKALKAFYDENKGKNPAFDNPPLLKTPEGIKIEVVEFRDESSAKRFLAKAEKPGADFKALAKEINKDVTDLGLV